MVRLLLITGGGEARTGLNESLAAHGFTCAVAAYDKALEELIRQLPDMLLIEIDDEPSVDIRELVREIRKERAVPVMAMVSVKMLDSLDGQLDIDDFITAPYDTKELALRVKRLLHRQDDAADGELIKCDGLLIDLARCEVTVDGRIAQLTFKEYELLKLLAGNPGRVYTREVLLNMVWGYDYFGGDRTVDVHIRRLRGKIEDSHHTYIETVRNIGYRFKREEY